VAEAMGSRCGDHSSRCDAGVGWDFIHYDSYYDLWASFNGGIKWTTCRLPVNGGFIRGEQAVALTADEKLIVGNGYRYSSNPPYRTEFSDLFITDISLSNTAQLARICSTIVPEEGIGLRAVEDWTPFTNSSNSDPSCCSPNSSSGLNTALIVFLVLGGVALLSLAVYSYRRHQRTGSWNLFASTTTITLPPNIDSSGLLPLDTSVYYDSSTNTEPKEGTNDSTQMAAF